MQTNKSSQIPRIVEAIENIEVKEAVETANEVKEPLEAKSRSWRSKNRWRLNPEAVETADEVKEPLEAKGGVVKVKEVAQDNVIKEGRSCC